ncbi:MAG TPA: hypothetical protein VKB25_12530 [Conexibacter sp.]|nr:hypothetical protein [Conexibacter sp.]
MSPNRIVALLTPLVFAPLAGAVAAWLAEHFPGIEVDQESLQQIFIAGALVALVPATQWLHGWQKHEARQAELERDVALASLTATAATATAMPVWDEDMDAGAFEDPDDDFDELPEPPSAEFDDAFDATDDDDELDELEALGDLGDFGEADDLEDEPLDDDDLAALEG